VQQAFIARHPHRPSPIRGEFEGYFVSFFGEPDFSCRPSVIQDLGRGGLKRIGGTKAGKIASSEVFSAARSWGANVAPAVRGGNLKGFRHVNSFLRGPHFQTQLIRVGRRCFVWPVKHQGEWAFGTPGVAQVSAAPESRAIDNFFR